MSTSWFEQGNSFCSYILSLRFSRCFSSDCNSIAIRNSNNNSLLSTFLLSIFFWCYFLAHTLITTTHPPLNYSFPQHIKFVHHEGLFSIFLRNHWGEWFLSFWGTSLLGSPYLAFEVLPFVSAYIQLMGPSHPVRNSFISLHRYHCCFGSSNPHIKSRLANNHPICFLASTYPRQYISCLTSKDNPRLIRMIPL